MIWPSILMLLGSLFAAQAAEISGQVIDAQTGAPIMRAHVKAWITPSGGQATELAILTDGAGSFTIKSVPEGNCQFAAERPGYVTSQTTGPPQSVVVARDSESPSVVIRLVRQAVIEGSVVDEKGAGMPLTSIQLWRQAIIEGRRGFQSVYSGQTDEAGSFRIFGLAAGRYYLSVTAQHRSRALAYPPMFYPDTPDIHTAQPIGLRPGQEERLEVRLRPVRAHEIRGQITPPGRYASFTLRAKNPAPFSIAPIVGWYWDEKTGAFKMSGVPSDLYLLEISTQQDGKRLRASTTIAVGDKDVAGIMLAPDDWPALTGTVTADGQPATRPAVHISLRSPRGNFGAQLNADGSFRFNDLPADTYRLDVISGGLFYPRSIRQGGRELLPDRVVNIGTAFPEPVEIVLSPLGATIDGTVPLPDAGSRAATVVALLRHTAEGLLLENQAYVTGVVGPNIGTRGVFPTTRSGTGRFRMQGVAPGDYVLFAWPQDAQIEYANPEIMRQYDSMGKTVSVSEGAKLTVNLDRLLPRPDP